MIEIRCQAILFDADGVLVDSVTAVEQSWTHWANEYGLDPAAVLDGIHGVPGRVTVRRWLPAEEEESAER